MALDAANVEVAITGAIYAGTGATLPTDATTPITGLDDLGYMTPDGITETINETRTVIRAWQNADPVREIRTDHEVLYAFMMMETKDETLSVYYGQDVTGGAVLIKAGAGKRGQWIIEEVDGDKVTRTVIPDGEVTSDGKTVTMVNNNTTNYPVTVFCYPDANGVKAYQYRAVVA